MMILRWGFRFRELGSAPRFYMGAEEGNRDSTTSLRSSIYDYMEENGRTYHAFNSGSMKSVRG